MSRNIRRNGILEATRIRTGRRRDDALEELIHELQEMKPESSAGIVERYSEREYLWRNPQLRK